MMHSSERRAGRRASASPTMPGLMLSARAHSVAVDPRTSSASCRSGSQAARPPSFMDQAQTTCIETQAPPGRRCPRRPASELGVPNSRQRNGLVEARTDRDAPRALGSLRRNGARLSSIQRERGPGLTGRSTKKAVWRPMRRAHGAQIWAWIALAGAVGVLATLLVLLVRDLRALVIALLALALAGAALWIAATRRGIPRLLALVALCAALAGGAGALVRRDAVDELVAVAVATAVFATAGRGALRGARDAQALAAVGPPAPAPQPGRAVLLINPKSGGGRAERFDLADQARKRGVEPIVLEPGDDLLELAERAVGNGAEVIGMAGGDGSQALVATVAMRHGIAHVCIPAGTRNHFALDLGIDRDDPVAALDAFTDGVERRVDLACVNDRIFVNNASLGVYAKVVQSDTYRDAKLETWAETLPELLGPDAAPIDLEFDGPSAAHLRRCPADPGLQQRLPAHPSSRSRDPPAHRQRPARHRRSANPQRERPRRAHLPRGDRPDTTLSRAAAMVATPVRSPLHLDRRRRARWRSAHARAATAVRLATRRTPRPPPASRPWSFSRGSERCNHPRRPPCSAAARDRKTSRNATSCLKAKPGIVLRLRSASSHGRRGGSGRASRCSGW